MKSTFSARHGKPMPDEPRSGGQFDSLPLPHGKRVAEVSGTELVRVLQSAGVHGVSASQGRDGNLEKYAAEPRSNSKGWCGCRRGRVAERSAAVSDKIKALPTDALDWLKLRFEDRRTLGQIPTDEFAQILDGIFQPVVKQPGKEDKPSRA